MTTPAGDPDRATALQVADGLRDAFAAVAAAPLPAEDRATWQRRLLAITTLSKRDVQRAKRQLDRFMRDLDGVRDGTAREE